MWVSFEEALNTAKKEGIVDVSCVIFRLPFHIDYAKIYDAQRKAISISVFTCLAEFYEFFRKVQPLQLKGIIREAVVPIYQQFADANGFSDNQIDLRQISIDIVIDYVPCTSK